MHMICVPTIWCVCVCLQTVQVSPVPDQSGGHAAALGEDGRRAAGLGHAPATQRVPSEGVYVHALYVHMCVI